MFHGYETDTQNSPHASVPSPISFAPTLFSSPTVESTTAHQVHHRVISQTFTSLSSIGSASHATPAPLLANSRNWRTLILIANSISGKRAELANIVDHTKPDAILITETKLDASIKSSKFMPPGYLQLKRRDRTFAGGGGVLIAVHDCSTAVEIDPPASLTAHDEIIWVEVSLRNKQKLILGCFYHTPSGKPHQQLDGLESSLNHIKQVERPPPFSTSAWSHQRRVCPRLDCFPVPYGIVGLVLAKRPCCDVMWASTADWLLHRFADFPRVLPSSDRMQPSEHAEPTVNNMAPPGRSCCMYRYNTIWSCLLLPIYWTVCCRLTNKVIPEPVICYNWNSRNKLVWVLTHLWTS